MTVWKKSSFDSRLSDRNSPSGSESSVTMFQNSASESESGRASAPARTALGAIPVSDNEIIAAHSSRNEPRRSINHRIVTVVSRQSLSR